MRLPKPPADASRFYAQQYSGVLECPRCGRLLYYQTQAHGRRKANCAWDPRTSTIECTPGCGLTLIIGTIAWPIQPRSGRRTTPEDHVPNERQNAQLRAMAEVAGGVGTGAGWWMPREQAKPQRRPKDTNLTQACICLEARRDPQCPIHGDQHCTCSEWAKKGLGEPWQQAEGSAECPVHGVPDERDQVNTDKWPR